MKAINCKVEQFEGSKNQFIVRTDKGNYFQSYKSMIVFKPFGGQIQLDQKYWDYSKTTGKFRNKFLNETKKETEKKIKDGIYILTDLN